MEELRELEMSLLFQENIRKILLKPLRSREYTGIQYTLANPNRGVPIRKISVPITEFVRIGEVALLVWRINDTKICGYPLLLI